MKTSILENSLTLSSPAHRAGNWLLRQFLRRDVRGTRARFGDDEIFFQKQGHSRTLRVIADPNLGPEHVGNPLRGSSGTREGTPVIAGIETARDEIVVG